MIKLCSQLSSQLILFVLTGLFVLNTQEISGQTITELPAGAFNGDRFGFSLDMPNSSTLITGAPQTTAGEGYAILWKKSGDTWANDHYFNGSPGEYYGYSVAMPDEHTIAIGAYGYKGLLGMLDGRAEIHKYDTTTAHWIKVDVPGNNGYLYGAANSGNQLGAHIEMPHPNYIAIGEPYADPAGINNAGQIKVYRINGTSMQPRGTINGYGAYTQFGNNFHMPDSNTIIVGSLTWNGFSGLVRVYTYNPSTRFIHVPSIVGTIEVDSSFL